MGSTVPHSFLLVLDGSVDYFSTGQMVAVGEAVDFLVPGYMGGAGLSKIPFHKKKPSFQLCSLISLERVLLSLYIYIYKSLYLCINLW